MSAALLAKLKVKKPPQARESIDVVIARPSERPQVTIQAKVVDQTTAAPVDREAFLARIQSKRVVRRKGEEVAKVPVAPPPRRVRKLKKKLVLTTGDSTPASTKPEDGEKKLVVKPGKRRTRKPMGVATEGPASLLRIGDTAIGERVGPPKEDIRIRASSYYMNNREIFINFITSLYGKYKAELGMTESEATCDRDEDAPFSPMAHQKIVRDYITQYTPYRGVLLFHGLGSGKTCSSVAIAEGMKTSNQIIVMTPASLRMNYIEELKKCGDDLYRKNQFWEFINTQSAPELIDPLSSVLSLPVEFIRRQGGAWLMNITKQPNFKDLDSLQKKSLDDQLNEMIRYKYKFINYNGMRMSHLKTLTKDFRVNPFDNAVIIIDEAHNFVSRIVNKMGRDETLSSRLYEYLMDAQNARIVLLTGTPIINYPNEIAIMFNILRGRIKTWTFNLTINKERKVSQEFFESIFKSTVLGGNIMDFVEYKPTSTTLVITRNPFGFINKTKKGVYDGVRVGDRGEISDEDFIGYVTRLLQKNGITVNPAGIRVSSYKALPDTLQDFQSLFIDEGGDVKNMNLFKRRIVGLASYFRDMYSLMPKYEKDENFHIVRIPMSNFQFGVYEEARIQERKLELQNARKRKKRGDGVYEDTVSTYRIFSRAFCNFVFPRPDIKRPLPGRATDMETAVLEETADEDMIDAADAQQLEDNVDGRYDGDDIDATDMAEVASYEERIKTALASLDADKERFLSPDGLETYSPKFLNILENIKDVDHRGLHLIYSQFRTLEGVGILKLVLEANGFARFKVRKDLDQWRLDIAEADRGKPMFALYTGTETPEEKEIIRNVFNSTWKYVPSSLATELRAISSNNLYGEIIKVLMITASGAEGISLRNVRYVHITEPYWHPVRLQQVIGRARRICSHNELPEPLRTVDVFLYLMTFSQAQLDSDEAIELRLKDKSKIDNLTPVTSDEALYEIATMKEELTTKLLTAVKEASIDCALHSKAGDKEQLKCFTFGSVNPNKFAYQPSYSEEESDAIADRNKTTITWEAKELKIDGITYAYNELTGDVYNLESYKRGNPVQVGRLEISGKGKNAQFKYIPI